MVCPEPTYRLPPYDPIFQFEAAQTKLNKAGQAFRSMPRSELTAEEYATDDFRMFHFKVTRCCKRFVHDWRDCPFAHSTENARRRDPRECGYLPIACPNYKSGFCLEGDNCLFAHGVYECWLHPAKYRTQMCKDTPGCAREVCFFAHTPNQLRRPHLSTAKAEREVFAKLGVSSLEELGLEDWSQLLSPGSPNSVSGFHHFDGAQDQAMSPVLQQYILQQKHQHRSPAIARAPARAPEANRPRMSNAMARHLGIIPSKDQRQRISGESASMASSLSSMAASNSPLPAAYSSYLMPHGHGQGFIPADAFAQVPMQPSMLPGTDFSGYQPEQSPDLLQLASHLNYFNLSNQAGMHQPGLDQAALHSSMLNRMSVDQRVPLDHPFMAPGTMSLEANPSIRQQLATCLGFPASSGNFERSASFMSSASMVSDHQTSLGSEAFSPHSQTMPIQRPRRNASGQVYWL